MGLSTKDVAEAACSAFDQRLTESGWTSTSASPWNSHWTLERPNGLLATIAFVASPLGGDDPKATARAGAGYIPASWLRLALTQSLGSDALARPTHGRLLVQDLPATASDMAVFAEQAASTAITFADAFRGASELLDHLDSLAESGARAALTDAFLVAGAAGVLERAAGYLTRLEALEEQNPSHQRLLRRARHWLDTGGQPFTDVPVAPPRRSGRSLERPDYRHILLASLRKADIKHDAELRLARRMRRDRTLTTRELRAGLAADLAERGTVNGPTSIAVMVDRVQRSQGVLGLARTTLYTARFWAELAVRVRSGIKTKTFPGAPRDAETPGRAAHTYTPARGQETEVQLDPAAIPGLRDLAERNERRIKEINYFTVWIDGAGSVHIGDRRVGELDPDILQRFSSVLAAAAFMDEDVRTPGFFVDLDEPVLAIPLPADDLPATC